MIDDKSLTDAQQILIRVRQKREELEKRLGYKAPPLSDEDQALLETEFHNAARIRRWIE